MKSLSPILTENQVAYVLHINMHTLDVLVRNGLIPHTYVDTNGKKELRFNTYIILDWLKQNPNFSYVGNIHMNELRDIFNSSCPDAIDSLKKYDMQFAEKKKSKGYYFEKVKNKRYDFLYYVKYIDNGVLVYSRWNTYTNNIEEAERFAIENRERLLAEYYAKRQPEHVNTNIYYILNNYYKLNSIYLDEDKLRGRNIAEKTRRVHYNFLRKTFIPHLRKSRVVAATDITPSIITNLQIALMKKGLEAQTINHYFAGVRAVFNYLAMKEITKYNVFTSVIKLRETNKTTKGCYPIDIMKGIFNQKWEHELEYLLLLIAYTANLRNHGIERIKPQDIEKIKDCFYIHVNETKTENGIRTVPLHPFVYRKIMSYVRRHKIKSDQFIFSASGGPNQSTLYNNSNLLLGIKLCKKLKVKPDDVKLYLRQKRISFLSSRHFWKTLMSAGGLGEDAEEYFMGHSVTSDVKDLYNHHDKKGQAFRLKKAREVYKILDRYIFKKSA